MDPTAIHQKLLGWYDRHRRDLPWRAKPGETADPYRVWLSEIMLQQTTVKTVQPYYLDFLKRWPTAADLASADRDDVLRAWAGLGYYARARNLHACAKAVAARPGGTFPTTEAELLELPGIGPYTAAAIAAIAFDRAAMPVDGNIERVMARLFAVEEPLPRSKKRLAELARGLTPQRRAGDFAQALPLRQTSCRLHRTTQGSMKDGHGSTRTGIQGQGGCEVAAPGERGAGGGGARCGPRSGTPAALGRRCAVQACPRAGLDWGRAA